MIMVNDKVITALIIVTMVVRSDLDCCLFLIAALSDVVYRWIVKYLLSFKRR